MMTLGISAVVLQHQMPNVNRTVPLLLVRYPSVKDEHSTEKETKL